jgi:pimeloyl-ACP methyl ester carboxylesterase
VKTRSAKTRRRPAFAESAAGWLGYNPSPMRLLSLSAGLWCASAVAAPTVDGGVADSQLAVHLFGELGFKACSLSTPGLPSPIEAFCASVEVPLDSARPSGPTVSLAIAWLQPTEKAGAAKDPALLLAGGPGQSSREQAAYVGRMLRELRRHQHLLFVDQRGTGASTPLTCAKDDARTPEAIAAAMTRCRQAFTVDPRPFTTRQSAEDLEWVRKKLGGVRFNLIGVSYGTRLAQEYARAHPDGVRTLVLDGVVPPRLALGKGFGQSLDAALARALGPALAPLDEALKTLQTAQPVSYPDPYTGELHADTFSAEDLMRLIQVEAYQPLFIATFPQLFRDARDKHWGTLAAQAKILERTSGIAAGLHYAIACAEDVPQLTDADAESEAKTRMGRSSLDAYRAVCRDWPVTPAPATRLEPLKSDAPTLLLSGEWDPVTPPEGAALVAATLTHARHLVLPGQGHNVIGVGCMPRVVAHFLEAGKLEGLDVTCLEKVKPLRPFTSRTGWDP